MSRSLKYALPVILLFFICGSALGTESIYTWTDNNGVIHMTNRQPPKNVTVQDQIEYQPEALGPTSIEQDYPRTNLDERSLKKVQEKAVQERQKAQAARRKAQKAIGQAERQVKEATAYYEKVKNKSLKRKSLRIKIEKQYEAAENAKLKAEQLNLQAIEAERQARMAEEAAQKLTNPEG